MTRVLGIDPGSRVTGFGVLEGTALRPAYLASGCIRAEGDTVAQRLCSIFEGIETLLAEFRPQVVAVESVFVQRNASSAIKLGQARGAVLTAIARAGIAVAEYSPARIKLVVTGGGRAAKAQVQFMVSRRLGLTFVPPPDAADALAGALCHLVVGAAPGRVSLAGGSSSLPGPVRA